MNLIPHWLSALRERVAHQNRFVTNPQHIPTAPVYQEKDVDEEAAMDRIRRANRAHADVPPGLD